MRGSTWPIPFLVPPLLFCAIAFSTFWRRFGGTGPVAAARAALGAALLSLAADFTAGLAQAPPPAVALGPEVQVSLEREAVPHYEPHISVNPRDPQHLLVASVSYADDRTGLVSCSSAWCSESIISAAFVSFDGGGMWRPVELECDLDPWTAFDTAGNAYVSCLHPAEVAPGRWRMLVALHRSRDGGRSFTGPTLVPAGGGTSSDRPFLAVDTTSGPRAGTLYVVRGQSISVGDGLSRFGPSIVRSVDQGESFLEPAIHTINNLDHYPAGVELLSDGDLAVLYVEARGPNGVVPRQDLIRVYNLNFRDPRVPDSRSWVFVSKDGGDTFGPPRVVAEHPVTAFSVDSSERFFGRWYVAMSATLSNQDESWRFEDGSPSGVYVMYSDDSGESWSTPTRVSDSAAPTLVGRAMIAVNRDGDVGVAWYDGRNGSGEDCYDVYFSVSVDGADTFAANRRLSSVTSCQNVPGNVLVDPGGERDIAARFPLGGDYSGLAAGPDGRFHAVWADSRTSVYQLWTRSMEVAGR